MMARFMMTSSNGSIFRVTGLLCGEFTGHQWNPRTWASDAELWCFLWFAPWINGWVNNGESGDLRGDCAHYDVIVMLFFLTHVCISQPWCVDAPPPNTTYVHCWYGSLLVRMMGYCLFGVRPSTEPMMTSHQSVSEKHFQLKCDRD